MLINGILILIAIAECVLVVDSVWYKALNTPRVSHKNAWIMSVLAGIVLIGLIMQAACLRDTDVCSIVINILVVVMMSWICCIIRKW